MPEDVTQERVEGILLTQPLGLLQLLLRMSAHLRGEVRQLFPALTPAEYVAVCAVVVSMMQESVERARRTTERQGDDHD